MKHLRLVALVLAVSAFSASLVIAGGKGKGARSAGTDECCAAKSATAATSASGACPASMSCPAGSAQCAKSAKTAGAATTGSCAMHGATAAASGKCAMHGTTTAAAGNCAMHSGTTATTAASTGGCPMTGKSAMAAGGCTMHGAAAAGGKCDMASGASAACVLCADEAACDQEMRGLNSHAQVVELRNGAMIVYTADTPENVRALQVALARHNEQAMNALAANSETSLCSGCKTFRGAMASGKFSRELVNVKNGAQVLLTSSDRTIVHRIHELAGTPSGRIKT